VLQVASPESGTPSLLVPRCRYRLKEFVVNWFTRYVFGGHVSKWLALAMVALVGVALLKLVIWLLTPQSDADERDKDYWRIHGS
jgi:hypothetical protein